MTAPLDPVGVNQRLLLGDTLARARSSSPILSGALRLASASQFVALPRLADFMSTIALTPSWPALAATGVLRAQLDQTRHLRPGLVAAMTAASARPTAWAMPELASPSSLALEAIRAQSALATRPLFAELARVSTGLAPARVETLTRGLSDLAEHPGDALDDQDADDVVALLEYVDADARLVTLDAMQDVVLDTVDSEPVAELLEHVDLDRLAELEPDHQAALEQHTHSALGALRRRMRLFSANEVTTLVLAPTSLAVTIALDVLGVDISPLGQHLSLPVGLLAISSYAQTLNQAAERRQALEQQNETDDIDSTDDPS